MPFTMKDAAFVSAEKEKGSVDGSAKRQKLDFGSMVTLDSMPQTKRAQKKPAAAPLNVCTASRLQIETIDRNPAPGIP